jgi:hypothetical protein
MGSGIPKINPVRGGFQGGIRTRYESFFPQKFVRTSTNDEYADYESEGDYDRQSTYRSRDNYYEKRPRSPYNGNVLVFERFYFMLGVPS